jgi:hypothetical protein
MMKIARNAILSLSIPAITFCCFASELVPLYVEKTPVEIGDGYSLGKPALSGLRLCGIPYACYDDPSATCYPTIVEQSVVKIGWDENFILVERHPLETLIFATPDATNPSWFIVVISSGIVYENLSYKVFDELIKTLGIRDIEMQDALNVYKQNSK